MDNTAVVLVTLVIYNALLISVGLWARGRNKSVEDIFLGGPGSRALGSSDQCVGQFLIRVDFAWRQRRRLCVGPSRIVVISGNGWRIPAQLGLGCAATAASRKRRGRGDTE